MTVARAAWHERVPCKPDPADESELRARMLGLRAHMLGLHGLTVDVLDRHRPQEWAVWHGAEHRTRHPEGRKQMHAGHLRHTHPAYLPKADAAVVAP